MVFTFQGRFAFLTYAQTDVANDDLYWHLSGLKPIKRCVIVRERHTDGNWHSHTAIEFQQRFQTSRADFFDWDGHHPNIQRVRSWGACVNYCRKDQDNEISYYGCTAEDATERSREEAGGEQAYSYAIAAQSRQQWNIYCIDNSIAYAWAEAIWKETHGARAPTYHERPAGGVIGGILHQMRAHERVTVVLGPSGIGKTSWAKREATLPFLFVTDIDDLAFYDPEVHKSIVFDEVRFNGDPEPGARRKGKWPLTAQIKLVTWDDPVSIRIRYKIAHIPAHVQKIFTCTDTWSFSEDTQIKRRIHCIDLYTDLTVNRWD